MRLNEISPLIGPPYVLAYDGSQLDAARRLKLLGVTPWIIELGAARDDQGLFEAFRTGLHMPYAEITNWDALEETLADLSWLRPTCICIVIRQAEHFVRRDDASFRILIDVLNTVGAEWAMPVRNGDWWDRDAVPFHALIEQEGTGLIGLVTVRG